jgi:hypothetical protein
MGRLLGAFKSRPSATVKEFLKQLEADPEYVRRKREKERELADREAQSRAAQTSLLDDLNAVGVKIRTVWDLVNTSAPYRGAIPVLLSHLPRPYPEGVREGIAKALAVKPTRALGWRILVEEYTKTSNEQERVKDGLAVALSGASDSSVLTELIELARDRSHGSSRILLLLGIRRSRRPEATRAIEELANDPELAKEIQSWRRRRA